ncbi:MAG TPA: hydrogenase maturation protease [Acidimicrobiales bacterium]|nr:hydrogenase maturation protease [Acidimicrobiales bacterium]
MSARVLVAGVGNIFLGDDGFGVEVAHRLQGDAPPDGVQVVDAGIRGMHLAYDLLDGYDGVVLVDALARGDAPGTLSVIEVDPADVSAMPGPPVADPHGFDPATVLAYAQRLGCTPRRVLVVGCEVGGVEPGVGLSEPVAAAVPAAVELVRRVVAEVAEEAHA